MDEKHGPPLELQPQPGMYAVPPPQYDRAVSPQQGYAQPYPMMQQPSPQQPYPVMQQPVPQQQYQPMMMGQQQVQYMGGPPGMIQGQPTVVIVNAGGPMSLSENPASMNCPHCQANILTRVEYTAGMYTWLLVFMCCMLGCILCCVIPMFYDGCKDVEHFCPSCHTRIGVWRRMESNRRNYAAY